MSKRKAPAKDQTLDGAFLRSKLWEWYAAHERPLPWRVLFKKHRDPWHIWVSEIMLQQTVIKAVMPVYERFLKQFPTPKSLAHATSEDIRLAVRGLGYYRRFDLLHRACIKLVTEKRKLPTSHDEWLELPGVGAYTAAAISSIALDLPHGVVDGNVERVLCRLMDIRTEPNLPELKKRFKVIMDDLCSSGNPGALNQAVMELGQTICTPSSPNCPKCPVVNGCLAFKNSSQSLAPAAKSKQEPIDMKLRLEIVRHGNKIALMQRPDDAKFLKGTWGFITAIQNGSEFIADGSPKFAMSSKTLEIGSIKHSITKHKIIADVVVSQSRRAAQSPCIRLTDPKDIEKNLVSNLDRKAWNLLLKSDGVL